VKPEDKLLLAALATALILMLALVLAPAAPADSTHAPDASLRGEPRDLDLDLLRRRLIRGELSDHEALYYHHD